MRLQLIDGRIPTSNALVSHVTQKFTSVLKVFADRLGDVQVRITDVNGPKGGVDKSCTAFAHIHGSGAIAVKVRSTDFYGAIDRAAQKLRRAIDRRVSRSRTKPLRKS
ncbi:MAG TPA: HPF/RaiA family ribosome-associated protein [Phycisphaerales bacterium]|nr:HPF/RaiA family ribosome-associated protein [Phycisphaerales bacterium]